MKVSGIVTFLAFFIFLACNDSSKKSTDITIIDSASTNTQQLNNVTEEEETKNEKDFPVEGCIRGTPEPIVNKNIFPQTTFKLLPDSMTAFETVDFDNGDKLIIKNWGCESYCLTFRFETNRFQEDINNTKYWFEKAIELTKESQKGIQINAVDIDEAMKALKKYTNKTKHPSMEEQLSYGQNAFGNFLTVDKIEKMDNKKYGIEFTFVVGL